MSRTPPPPREASPFWLLLLFFGWATLLFVGSIEALKLRAPLQRRSFRTPTFYRRLDVQEEMARRQGAVEPLIGVVGTPGNPPTSAKNRQPPIDFSSITAIEDSAVSSSYWWSSKPKVPKVVFRSKVTDAHQLRQKVLDENVPLKQIQVDLPVTNTSVSELLNHQVVQLLAQRFQQDSKPGARNDPYTLALCMEGGGMRGAVSAGMAAAIASLGLTDCFDKVYGSSAGSVIGAYMISRQMCMDVYVDILPAAKRSFVCVKRMLGAIAVTALDWGLSKVSADLAGLGSRTSPGMNISFVLDGIMHDTHGIRPLDLESFQKNDRQQPLRVASSYVKNGRLYTKCFGSENFDPNHPDYVRRADGKREGIYASLEASMTVPGATGPPVPITQRNETCSFFDAFCFEPLPYRSAVAEGATHALVLCSRPEGFQPKTVPGVYERGIAPIYFRSHGLPRVAQFFEQGGQQYIYAEDLLTLEEGKVAGMKNDTINTYGVRVPPPEILHGVARDYATERLASDRGSWKKAHLLPLKVPLGTPELPTLEQERTEVSDAVRGGFAAAFDILAPAIGLKIEPGMTGAEVAELVFPPDAALDEFVLDYQLRVQGDDISSVPAPPHLQGRRKRDIIFRLLSLRRLRRRLMQRRARKAVEMLSAVVVGESEEPECVGPGEHLLSILPGFASGKMAHLAAQLRNCTVG